MSDTVRTTAALQALLADTQPAHTTNRQLLRDLLVSLDITRKAVINLKDAPYLAVGDGVADDTAAINSWYAAIPDGGTGLIPNGRFRFTSKLSLNRPVSIIGTGLAACLFPDLNSAVTDAIVVNDTGATNTHLYRVRFDNFSILSNSVNACRDAFVLWRVHDSEVNLHVRVSAARHGVLVNGCLVDKIRIVTSTNINYPYPAGLPADTSVRVRKDAFTGVNCNANKIRLLLEGGLQNGYWCEDMVGGGNNDISGIVEGYGIATIATSSVGSAILTAVGSTNGVVAGMAISGVGIPAGTTVLSLVGGITMSANATANGVGVGISIALTAAVRAIYIKNSAGLDLHDLHFEANGSPVELDGCSGSSIGPSLRMYSAGGAGGLLILTNCDLIEIDNTQVDGFTVTGAQSRIVLGKGLTWGGGGGVITDVNNSISWIARESISLDKGDANYAPSYLSETTILHATPLTAARTDSLPGAAGAGVRKHMVFRFRRTSAATGAFPLNINNQDGALIRALYAGQWCDVQFDGTNWRETASGYSPLPITGLTASTAANIAVTILDVSLLGPGRYFVTGYIRNGGATYPCSAEYLYDGTTLTRITGTNGTAMNSTSAAALIQVTHTDAGNFIMAYIIKFIAGV